MLSTCVLYSIVDYCITLDYIFISILGFKGQNVVSKKGMDLKILGKDYQVACPEDQTHKLIDAALMLDSKMKEIKASGRVIGLERIAVMAALNLAHELLNCREQIQTSSSETEQKVLLLCDKLDEVLTPA